MPDQQHTPDTQTRGHRAILTVTATSRPDGGNYFDQADFAGHVTEWVRAGLSGKHAVDEVTITEAPQLETATTADKAAALGLTDTEYRARSHAAAVAAIRAAIPGMYAHVGFQLEDVLNEADEAQQAETQARRRLTEGEYNAAWHAVEGAAGEEGADPATVLHAVLNRLGIDLPAAPAVVAQPETQEAP